MYAYLLSQEQVELARGAEASWERLMHVRHLKDRMISEDSLFSRVNFDLSYSQGNAGAWLASARGQAKRLNSVHSMPLPISLSRSVRSRDGTEQSNH